MGFKLLVAQVNSDLWEPFVQALEDLPYTVLDTAEKEDVQWSDPIQVEAYFDKVSPSIVISLGMENEENALNTDQSSFTALVAACRSRNIPFIHISSYRVFGLSYRDEPHDELAASPPDENDEVASRLYKFEQLASSVGAHIILRVNWLMASQNHGLLDRIVPLLLRKKEMVVSDHHFGYPISHAFVVRAIVAIVHQILCDAENWGVFHLRSSDACSEAEFADHVHRYLTNELSMDGGTFGVAAVGDSRALMPGVANVNGQRCTDNFGIQLPSWRAGFKSVIKPWLVKKNYITE